MTATTSHGQRTMVAAIHSCNGHRTSSSHGTGASTNVDGWTPDELQHSSISASAGAQLRNTYKASRTDMNWKSTAHDTQASTSVDIGSTESRPVALGWSLDYNESDRPSSLNVDLFGQRSASPAASLSAKGGSSEDHPSTESPGDRKRVDVNLQVDLIGCSIEEELVTRQTDPPHRFNTKTDGISIPKAKCRSKRRNRL